MTIKRLNKKILIPICMMAIISIITIYSALTYTSSELGNLALRQALWYFIGAILVAFLIHMKNEYLYRHTVFLYIFGNILLLGLLLFAEPVNNSRCWFTIPGIGSIQPSEFAKLGMIIFTSKYLTNSNKFLKSYKQGVFPILAILFFLFGLIMLQPDMGTGAILVVSIIALLFIAGVNMKFFIGMGIVGVIGVVFLIVIAPYRMDRITSFLDPWSDALGTGFQIIQSLYAIGPGGLLGTGFLNSIQKHFYLPEPQTDFIFSIIAEEFGVVGAFIVVGLFAIILWRGLKIALTSKDPFAKYLCLGMTFQIIFQAIMNLMVVIGMIPVTGVTLPFLSYGGSSLLISMISMGILLNVSRQEENR